MGKLFFDAFPTLKLSDGDRELFEEAMVTNLVSSSRRDKLNIHIGSNYFIPKDRIYAVEEIIRKQFFGNREGKVKILEKFELPSSYSGEAFIKLYKDSLILEFREMDDVLYQILKETVILFFRFFFF